MTLAVNNGKQNNVHSVAVSCLATRSTSHAIQSIPSCATLSDILQYKGQSRDGAKIGCSSVCPPLAVTLLHALCQDGQGGAGSSSLELTACCSRARQKLSHGRTSLADQHPKLPGYGWFPAMRLPHGSEETPTLRQKSHLAPQPPSPRFDAL